MNTLLIGSNQTLFYAFSQSDLFGKFIVLILIFMSILAWSIILDKALFLKTLTSQTATAQILLKKQGLARFLINIEKLHGPARLIAEQMIETLSDTFEVSAKGLVDSFIQDGVPAQLAPEHYKKLESSIYAVLDKETLEIENRLGLLSSIVSASPFMGLLGTVWGVMSAFVGMAIQGKADIKAIAPGVSGALLTTVIGLIVAIPAVIGFNLLVTRVKRETIELENLSNQLLANFSTSDTHVGMIHAS